MKNVVNLYNIIKNNFYTKINYRKCSQFITYYKKKNLSKMFIKNAAWTTVLGPLLF